MEDLTPGAVIEIEDNSDVCCDMVLLSGHCVVNEVIFPFLLSLSFPLSFSFFLF